MHKQPNRTHTSPSTQPLRRANTRQQMEDTAAEMARYKEEVFALRRKVEDAEEKIKGMARQAALLVKSNECPYLFPTPIGRSAAAAQQPSGKAFAARMVPSSASTGEVLGVLAEHLYSSEIVDSCCAAIEKHSFATINTHTEPFAAPALVTALERHATSASTCIHIFRALDPVLSNVTSEKLENLLIESEIVHTIGNAMQTHNTDPVAAMCGAQVLARLVRGHDGFKAEFLQSDLLPVCANLLRVHIKCPGVLAPTMETLFHVLDPHSEELTQHGKSTSATVLDCLTLHANVKSVAYWALKLLHLLATDLQTAMSLLDQNAITSVFVPMGKHPSHIGLQQTACALIAQLHAANQSDDSENQNDSTASGALQHGVLASNEQQITQVLGAMVPFWEVQAQACAALAVLAENEDAKKSIHARGGVQTVFALMWLHQSRAEIQRETCKLLSILSTDMEAEAVQTNIGSHDGLSSLLHAMELFPIDAKTQLYACKTLANVCMSGDGAKLRVVEHNGVSALLTAMGDHHAFDELQHAATWALALLCDDAECKNVVLNEGGVSAILGAMEEHPQHSDLQYCGCWAIAQLCTDEDSCMRVVDADGLYAVLRAMALHGDHPDLQCCACWALATVSSFEDNRDEIQQLGGIAAILAAMEAHPAEAPVQSWACKALTNLGADANTKDALLEENGVQCVVHSMKSHDNNADVQVFAMQALRMLCTHDELRTLALDQGVVKVVISAMDSLWTREDLLLEACSLVALLSKGSVENSTRTTQEGAAGAILVAMGVNTAHVGLQLEALRALSTMLASPACMSLLAEKGGVFAAICAMGAHSANEELIGLGCNVLGQLAVLPECVAQMRAENGLEVVLSALEANSNSPTLQMDCGKLVVALCEGPEGAAAMQEDAILSRCVLAISRSLALEQATSSSVQLKSRAMPLVVGIGSSPNACAAFVQGGGVAGVLALLSDEELGGTAMTLLAETSTHDAVRAELGTHNPVPAIIEAMDVGRSNTALLTAACRLLKHLCNKSFQNKANVSQKGGVAMVLRSMTEHPDCEPLHEHALNLLATLALDKEVRETLLEHKDALVVRIVTSMDAHTGHVGVVQQAITAISALSVDKNMRLQISSQGATQRIVGAMTSNTQHADLQYQAVRALVNMAVEEDNRATIGMHGGIAAVIAAMHAAPQHVELQYCGCRALAYLVLNSPENARLVCTTQALTTVIDAMRNHENVSDVQFQACSLLATVCKDSRVARQVRAAQGMTVVLSAVQNHPGHAQLQSRASEVVKQLKLSERLEETIVSVSSESNVGEILAKMRSNQDHPEIVQQACVALSSVATDAKVCADVGQQGAVELIAAAIKDHSTHDDMIATACKALSLLSIVDENRKRISACGGLELIIGAMAAHPTSSDLQYFACRAIVNLAIDDSIRIRLAEEGGVKVVLNAMRTHDSHEELQHCGCRAISHLSASASIRTVVALEGGVQVLLAAMRGHPKLVELQFEACRALSMLTVNADIRARVVKDGGAQEVLRAMSLHTAHPQLQLQVCKVLSTLCVDEKIRGVVSEEGGVAALVRVMETHLRQPNLQHQACWLMVNLSFNHPSNANKIVADGGLKSIVDAMKAHPDHVDLQYQAVKALGSLCFQSQNHAPFLANGCLPTLAVVLKTHRAKLDVQLQVLKTLSVVTVTEAVRKELAKIGGVALVVSTMKAFDHSPEIQYEACRVFVNVSVDEKTRKQADAQEAVSAVLAAMGRHPSNTDLLYYAMWALSHFAGGSKLAKFMIGHKSVASVVKTLQEHPTHEGLQMYGCRLLMTLAGADAVVVGEQLVACEGLVVLKGNIERFKAKSDIQRYICGVIASISSDKVVRREIGNAGLIPLVCKIMGTHEKAPEVQKQATRALVNAMFNNTNNTETAVDQGVVALLTKSATRFVANRDVVHGACRAIERISAHPDTCEQVSDPEVLLVLVESVFRHNGDEQVWNFASRALFNIYSGGFDLPDDVKQKLSTVLTEQPGSSEAILAQDMMDIFEGLWAPPNVTEDGQMDLNMSGPTPRIAPAIHTARQAIPAPQKGLKGAQQLPAPLRKQSSTVDHDPSTFAAPPPLSTRTPRSRRSKMFTTPRRPDSTEEPTPRREQFKEDGGLPSFRLKGSESFFKQVKKHADSGAMSARSLSGNGNGNGSGSGNGHENDGE